MLDHFRLLAGFNRWANGRVYDAAAALGEADYHKPRACAFLGSIHGTLNHLLVVDLLQGMAASDLTTDCRFTLISEPGERTMQPHLMLATVFNHQTHHRGQVHAMLKEAGAKPPALDIINYPEALG